MFDLQAVIDTLTMSEEDNGYGFDNEERVRQVVTSLFNALDNEGDDQTNDVAEFIASFVSRL